MNHEHSREMYLPGGTRLYLKREKTWEQKGIPCFVKLETLVLLSSGKNLLTFPRVKNQYHLHYTSKVMGEQGQPPLFPV